MNMIFHREVFRADSRNIGEDRAVGHSLLRSGGTRRSRLLVATRNVENSLDDAFLVLSTFDDVFRFHRVSRR